MAEQTLAEWLNTLETVQPRFTVTTTVNLGKETFQGCSYRDTNGDTRLYLLGKLPKSYMRRRKTCYSVLAVDWYVAGYTQGDIKPEFQAYHPFGEHFLLAMWDPKGPAIDAHEVHKYTRLPLVAEAVFTG